MQVTKAQLLLKAPRLHIMHFENSIEENCLKKKQNTYKTSETLIRKLTKNKVLQQQSRGMPWGIPRQGFGRVSFFLHRYTKLKILLIH